VEVLSSRVLIRPIDPERSHSFYGRTLGLAVKREFPGGRVYFAGDGAIEVSGRGESPVRGNLCIWLQVRDLDAEWARLAGAGVDTRRDPQTESWGLREAWIADPDGVLIVLVEVPADHPIRRDSRPVPG
jgi:catechol 2,3-dioxygenase-like lactoylglutathione lyase family enzyme